MKAENARQLREIDRIIASGLIFSSDGKLLMGRKDPAKGGVYPNVWHIPGGGVDVESGETLRQGFIKEMMQEVHGFDPERYEMKHLPQTGQGATEKTLSSGEIVWVNMEFNYFEVHLERTAAELEALLAPGDDLVELHWFSREELPQVEQIPGGRELFLKLGLMDA